MSQIPWWLATYITIFLVVTALWLRDEWIEEHRVLPIATEVLLDACLVGAAAAYWLPALRDLLGGFVAPLFCIGLASVVLAAAREFPKIFKDPNDSRAMKLGIAAAAISFTAVVYAPLIYWGLSVAFFDRYAGI